MNEQKKEREQVPSIPCGGGRESPWQCFFSRAADPNMADVWAACYAKGGTVWNSVLILLYGGVYVLNRRIRAVYLVLFHCVVASLESSVIKQPHYTYKPVIIYAAF